MSFVDSLIYSLPFVVACILVVGILTLVRFALVEICNPSNDTTKIGLIVWWARFFFVPSQPK